MNRIRKKFHNIMNPEIFQGNLQKSRNYFEGWYFKIVDKDAKNIYAFIPGISFGKNDTDTHAFIQMFNGISNDYTYFEFTKKDFQPDEKLFDVKIASSSFSSESIKLNINQQNRSVKGELQFQNVKPYPKTARSPGVMGWFAWIPFMEARHGVVSMDHILNGSLTIDGKIIDFTGGKGYIEKDYGRSFPSSYVWMQSNHFSNNNSSFMLSVAVIPFLGKTFTGFLSFLLLEGKVYRFATYTGAKITSYQNKENRTVQFTIEDKRYIIEITAEKIAGVALKSPNLGNMTARIFESLTSTLHLKLFKKNKGKGKNIEKTLIYEDTGVNAGLEIEDEKHQLKANG